MVDQIVDKFSFDEQRLWLLGEYEPSLVILSMMVAVASASVAMVISGHVSRNVASRWYMVASGSIALGGGVWAMHFIGMLAFNLCTPVDYRFTPTLLSMIPSIAASWVALSLLSQEKLSYLQLVAGGVLMGSGIGAMHYLGMEAMDMAPLLRYDPWWFLLSIIVAVVLAILALWIRLGLNRMIGHVLSLVQLNCLSGLVMGMAISGMHYTGMAAARFVQPTWGIVPDYDVAYSGVFVATIAGISLLLSLSALCGNLIFQYRRTQERAVKEGNRLRAIMDTAVDGIVTIDQQGSILSVNPAVERILGWTETDLLGKNVSCLVPEPFHSEHDGYLTRYQRTGEARVIGNRRDVTAVHKDGHEIPIRLAIGEGSLEQEPIYVAYIADITQRLAMENALRDNEAKFRSLIANIPGAAYRCRNNERWDMLFISDAVKNFTGYSASEFLTGERPLSFADLINPEDEENLVIPSVDGQEFLFEYRITDSGGNTRWIFDHGVYCEPDNKPGEGWLDGFMMDITDRVMLERNLRSAMEAAEEASKMKSAFLANMSHEIRTPMNAIIGFSDVLLQSSLDEQQQRHMKTVNQSARSLLHLLNDILDSAKLEKGKLELEPVQFSLSQLLDLVISTFWIQAKNKNLQLDLQINGGLAGYYLGAEDRIRQVLVNLVGNAVKFTEQGSVTLSATPIGSSAMLFEVVDTGIGIDEKALDSIFDPFSQADGSMSRRFGGTGLGTSISKQLVELMGGWIEMSSVLGEGTQVRFQIPLRPTNAPEQPLVENATDYAFPSLNILIADDVATNLDLLNIILERHGHRVTRASNGKIAFDQYIHGDFDLILMDVRMPEMDGLTASRKIRAWEQEQQRSQTPIIALTASVQEEEREATTQAGMDGFETKPVDIDRLLREMARVLRLDVRVEAKVKHQSLAVSVDFHQGVSLWGSKTVLMEEITQFLDEHSHCVQQLQEHLQQRQWRELEDRVHRLKGVAANLALTGLTGCFERLENKLFEENAEACSDLLKQLAAEFESIRQRLIAEEGKLERRSEKTPAEQSIVDMAELIRLLDRLQVAAADSGWDEEALGQFRQVVGSHWPEQSEALFEAFNNFDFVQAQRLIQVLRQQLERANDG